MKKLLFISLLLSISFVLFAKNEEPQYEEIEIDVNGELLTYYFFKTEEQLDNSINTLIKKIANIRYDFYMPSINTLKTQMVSGEYLEKNSPKFYKAFVLDNLNNDNGNNTPIIDFTNYKYCLCGQVMDNQTGILLLLKNVGEKAYLSMAIYMYSGMEWYYTKQALEFIEYFAN